MYVKVVLSNGVIVDRDLVVHDHHCACGNVERCPCNHPFGERSCTRCFVKDLSEKLTLLFGGD